jgi:hypothetical protein
MTIYNISKNYDNEGKIYYQVMPYNLKGTIIAHFKYYKGLETLFYFFKHSYLSEKKAKRVAIEKLNK